jgi:hypothetical protein
MDLSGFLRHVVVKSYDIWKESTAFNIRVAIMVEMDTEVFKWAIPVVFRFAIGY